jgi:nucleoid-associated protein YgaU
LGILLVCTAVALLLSAQVGFAQTQGMTYEEYKLQLAAYEQRVSTAKQALAACTQASDELSQQIGGLDEQIAAVQGEIYGLVDADKAGIDSYVGQIDQTESQLMGMLSLSDDDLFGKRDEFEALEELVKGLRDEKMGLLPDAQQKLRNIEQLLQRIDARMPRKRIKKYTVLGGDSLWRIAKKPDIYDDPYLWPRIYVENRGLIKDPDLIYPNWILDVPFGVERDQHLVMRGENLAGIAGVVYKDPTKWHKLYKANKTQILDPNLIFPAQVFDVPTN